MASVSKRTWTYKGVEKTAWTVRYKDRGGIHRQRTFELKKQADAFRRKVENELDAGSHIALRQTITVAELFDQYLRDVAIRQRDGLKMGRSYQKLLTLCLDKHLRPILAARRLTDLTFSEVEDASEELVQGGVSRDFARRVLRAFKAALDYGAKRGLVNGNVAAAVLQDRPMGERTPIEVFDREKVGRVLACLAHPCPKQARERAHLLTRCAVYLALFCGLRLGEILGLAWEAVDFQARQISVRHNLTAWGELKGPKTRAGLREVPMPDAVAAALHDWRPYFIENARGLIFTSRTGTPFGGAETSGGGSKFNKHYWRPLLVRAGLAPFEPKISAAGRLDVATAADTAGAKWLHFHALRHFYASMLIDERIPLTDVANLMGHAKFDMTLQVYAHSTAAPARRSSEINAMAASMLAHHNASVSHRGLNV